MHLYGKMEVKKSLSILIIVIHKTLQKRNIISFLSGITESSGVDRSLNERRLL
jgi:hypothetical protein